MFILSCSLHSQNQFNATFSLFVLSNHETFLWLTHCSTELRYSLKCFQFLTRFVLHMLCNMLEFKQAGIFLGVWPLWLKKINCLVKNSINNNWISNTKPKTRNLSLVLQKSENTIQIFLINSLDYKSVIIFHKSLLNVGKQFTYLRVKFYSTNSSKPQIFQSTIRRY